MFKYNKERTFNYTSREQIVFAVAEFGPYVSLMRRDGCRAGGTIKVCNLWLSLGGMGPHASAPYKRAYTRASARNPLAQESPKMEANYRIFGILAVGATSHTSTLHSV